MLHISYENNGKALSKVHNPKTFTENIDIAQRCGYVAGEARKTIERDTGRSVITSKNAAQLNEVVTNLIEDISDNTEDD